MHLDHAGPFYVVERVGLVAPEALLDACMLFAADWLIHHVEVHHVVAWRRLVALRTLGRFRARMQIAADLPGGDLVACGAIDAEKALMLVPGRMAGLAVEVRTPAGSARGWKQGEARS